jgi:integrase
MRRYYLHVRGGIFYAELVAPDGRKLAARSTGKTAEDEALLVVAEWLKHGVPSGRKRRLRPAEAVMELDGILRAIRKADLDGDDAQRIVGALKGRGLVGSSPARAGKGSALFADFLKEFWSYGSSPYVREKLAHGQSIGRRHCYENMNQVRLHYAPAFQGRPLDSITRRDLKEFSFALKGRGLSASSVNKILVCGATALSWAFREGLIAHNPAESFVRFSGKAKKRGVLSPREAEAVFSVPWKDKRALAGNLLSATTGMRSGEVLAVRASDIGDKALFARHSWSFIDGLKAPKNGEERKVPLYPETRRALMELLAENPHETADPFVFYGLLEDKPMDGKLLLNGLAEACSLAGIDSRARNIVFHSWRHYYAARMADKLAAEKVARVTGHKSLAVYGEYADHATDENLEEGAAAGAEVFKNVLRFRREA